MTDATLDVRTTAAEVSTPKVRGYWRTVGYRLRYDYVTLFFLTVVILMVLSAVFAPLLAPFDPTKTSMLYRLKPIGFRDFLLGTDELGRDMLCAAALGRTRVADDGLRPGDLRHHDRRLPRRRGRLHGRPCQHGHHAHDGCVLRVSVRAAGGGDFRNARAAVCSTASSR